MTRNKKNYTENSENATFLFETDYFPSTRVERGEQLRDKEKCGKHYCLNSKLF